MVLVRCPTVNRQSAGSGLPVANQGVGHFSGFWTLPVDSGCCVLASQGQGLREADLLVWLGDFNYRVDAHYDQAKEAVRRGDLQALLAKARASFITLYPSARQQSVHLCTTPGAPAHSA